MQLCRRRSSGSHGADDQSTREYRMGDDLRKIVLPGDWVVRNMPLGHEFDDGTVESRMYDFGLGSLGGTTLSSVSYGFSIGDSLLGGAPAETTTATVAPRLLTGGNGQGPGGQKPKPQPLVIAHTSSDNMTAEFEPKSGQMKRMKQWGQFNYEEGERHAIGETAYLEYDTNVMDIDKNARVWDASGSTNGDHIKLAQSTGDFNAEGHVATTRLPEAKKNASALLDDSQPSQGSADHVWSGNKNRAVHYEGHAALWQTGNRIQADKIDIDRDKKILVASGNVVSEFMDQDSDAPTAPAAPPYPVCGPPTGNLAATVAPNALASCSARPVMCW